MTAKHSRHDGAAFRITPDPRFLFPEPSHQAAFATVIGALRADARLIVIQGETGTGKTMLLKRLEGALRKIGAHVAYIPYAAFGLSDLLACFGPELGLASAASASTAQAAQRRVMLIDDAENSPDELLGGLDQRAAEHGIQIVLAGGTRLEARLHGALAEMETRIVARARLDPLAMAAVSDYVKHRLRVAGRADEFPPEAISAIAHYSRGVPRLINQVCGRALVLATAASGNIVSLARVAEAIQDCPAMALSGGGASPPAPAAVADVLPAQAAAEQAPLSADATTPDAPPLTVAKPVDPPAATAPREQEEPKRPQRTAARRPRPPATLPANSARAENASGPGATTLADKRPRYSGFVPLRRPARSPRGNGRGEPTREPRRRGWRMAVGLAIVFLIFGGVAYAYRAPLVATTGPAIARAEAAIERATAAAHAAYTALARVVRSWTERDRSS